MLFDKFQTMADFQAELAERNVEPFGAVTEKILSATEGVVQGRKVILAGTNNYLGLSYDPRCIKAAQDAAARWGTGTTGSRLANGSFAEHQALETEIAQFYGVDHAIVFSTGYAATMGMCATLAGPGDVILLDADSHASIYSGVKQSGAEVIRFKHNNPEDLAKRMRRLGDRADQALIIAEGIYSMLGDVAPLQEIAAVKREYGGYLFLDEAHSMGVLGATGRGAAQAAGVEADVDFFAGTFSKSLGAIGGFCVSRHRGTGSDPFLHQRLYVYRLLLALHHRFHARGAAHYRRGAAAARKAVGQRQPSLPGAQIPGPAGGPHRQPGGGGGNGGPLAHYRLLEGLDGSGGLRQPGDSTGVTLDQFPAAQQRQRSPFQRADRYDYRRLCRSHHRRSHHCGHGPLMDKIIITGNGPLRGEVRVAGAKNAALPIIAAALLSPEPLRISNIPDVRDIKTVLQLMELLGAQCAAFRHRTGDRQQQGALGACAL